MAETKITKEILTKLAKPFKTINWRAQKVVTSRKNGKNWGIMVPYIDARDVMDRLNIVVGPMNWSFSWSPVDVGTEKYIKEVKLWGQTINKDMLDQKYVVKGRLTMFGNVKEDVGYPNSDSDQNPLKSAVSDALKRCAVHFGVGRFLYKLKTELIEYDQYKKKPLNPNDLKKLENILKPIG